MILLIFYFLVKNKSATHNNFMVFHCVVWYLTYIICAPKYNLPPLWEPNNVWSFDLVLCCGSHGMKHLGWAYLMDRISLDTSHLNMRDAKKIPPDAYVRGMQPKYYNF